MPRSGEDGVYSNASSAAESGKPAAGLGGPMGDVAAGSSKTPRVWVVVGASRGIGLEYVRQVRPDRGWYHCLSQAAL